MPDRVGEEIVERALDKPPIGVQLRVAVDGHRHALVAGDDLEIFGDLVELVARLEGVPRETRLRVVGLGEEQHVFGHSSQPFEFFRIRLEHFAIFTGRALSRQRNVRMAEEVVDRRAELVREVGRERGEALEREMQAAEHCVERRAETPDFVRCAFEVEPIGEAVGGDRAGRRVDRPEGLQSVPGDDHADGGGGEPADHEHRPQPLIELVEHQVGARTIERHGEHDRCSVRRCDRALAELAPYKDGSPVVAALCPRHLPGLLLWVLGECHQQFIRHHQLARGEQRIAVAIGDEYGLPLAIVDRAEEVGLPRAQRADGLEVAESFLQLRCLGIELGVVA